MVKRILLAEHDPDIRFILQLVLNEAGYQVVPLSTGQTIVEGKHEWPDLFILDRSLPVVDGLTLSKFLKVKEETRDIPIIMISSYYNLKSRAREAGVDDFIEKPFDLQSLLSLVKKHTAGRDQKPLEKDE